MLVKRRFRSGFYFIQAEVTAWVRRMMVRRPWTGWSRSRSGELRSPRLLPTVSGRITELDRKSTRLNSSHVANSYAVFCLKKKNINIIDNGFCKFLKVYKGKTFGWGFFLIGYFNGVFEDFLRVLIRKIGLCLAFYEIVFFL